MISMFQFIYVMELGIEFHTESNCKDHPAASFQIWELPPWYPERVIFSPQDLLTKLQELPQRAAEFHKALKEVFPSKF